MSRSLLVILAAIVTGCSWGHRAHHHLLTQKLGEKVAEQATLNYVVRFDTREEAAAHMALIRSRGGDVESLDGEGRVQRVIVKKDAAADVTVSDSAMATLNTAVRIVRRETRDHDPATGVAGEDPSQAFQTARDVVGVTDLHKRFPEADGRGTKVAVFDTGIEFGVEGVSDVREGQAKLAGFFDLTGFGKTTAEALADPSVRAVYEVSGHALRFEARGEALSVESGGLLSEKTLARDYLAGEGIDLNENGKLDDVFPFLVGKNRNGQLAVWIDANGDGVIASVGEMLTDFNSTQSHIKLRPEASPSGARPLAVTITSTTALQFHAALNGHGTSCGIIIGGDGYANGRLEGMAPKTKLVSYVLDAAGQDVYTVDQFLRMFLHAREQGVSAISISWGFATGDLSSARFIGEFLDREIAAAGIVVGIAAGNEGPGLTSGAPDDYMPHNGFAVGAFISKDQARNVYGWVGYDRDSVIWYSSVGPSRGGRAVPDVVSPLMTLVRGQRTVAGPHFYGFGGTSSATPALIGATTALMSVLKAQGHQTIDTRLLKLAMVNSAHVLADVEVSRQGAGLIDVNRAYDLYLKYADEWRRAQADPSRRMRFPYELSVETALENSQLKGEGIHYHSYRAGATLTVKLSPASRALIDEGTFVELLTVKHDRDFVVTPESVALLPTGLTVSLAFQDELRNKPGVYADHLRFLRSDGTVLLTVPVVIEIPATAVGGVLATLDGTFTPYQVFRQPVHLARAGAITFEGLVDASQGGSNGYIVFQVNGTDGERVHEQNVNVNYRVQSVNISTKQLAPGSYEVLVARGFRRPAVLKDLRLAGAFRTDRASIEAVVHEGDALQFAVMAHEKITLGRAVLALEGRRISVPLTKDTTRARPGFYGSFEAGREEAALSLSVSQVGVVAVSEPMLHLEVSLVNRDSEDPVYRGWVETKAEGLPLGEVSLLTPTKNFGVVAFPNIVRWETMQTRSLLLNVETKLKADEIESYALPLANRVVEEDQLTTFEAALRSPTLVGAGVFGTVKLFDETDTEVATLRFSL